jgi:hypothetical protein
MKLGIHFSPLFINKADNASCFIAKPPTDLQGMMFTIYIASRYGTGA